jgi:hypothetical protein
MDPKACLNDARVAYEANEFVDASDRLREYFAWRIGDGFEPQAGDKLAFAWMDCIARQAELLMDGDDGHQDRDEAMEW